MFGNQFIEAVAVGTDAIVSEGTAMAENARRLRAGRVVSRENAPALAVVIREALMRPITLEARIERRKKVAAFVGPEAVATMHRAVYERLISCY